MYSHAGDWKAGDSSQFGWEKANPLEATIVNGSQSGILPATSYSFASVDKPNVQMVVMKQSEKPGKGITLRFYETEGVDTTGVKVSLPFFAPESANHTNIVEDIGYALPVNNNDITFNITKNGWETIRVYSGGTAPDQVTGLSASTVNDKALSLSWTANSDADLAGYNIYRSTDSGFSPNAYNLIGFSTTNSFTDDWLNPDTSYYYKVAAVDKKNNEGVISTEANTVTSSTNISAPRPVQNLTAIEYTNSSIIIGWDSNTESDISSYKIYRSTTAGFTPNDSTNLITNMAKLSYYKQYYTDTGLNANTAYYYKVLPVDIAGNVQNSSAVEVAATTSP